MIVATNYNKILLRGHRAFATILLFTSVAGLMYFNNHNSPKQNKEGYLFLLREGYDAKTGKWVNKKPSPSAFSISPDVYNAVKNWYATDSGTNNPNNLPVTAPKEGYTYIYTPYKDKLHPNVHGMSIQGENGYKGYWYADDLTKATDSTNDKGDIGTVQEVRPKDYKVEWGGYDARTGNWVHTQASTEAFPVSQGTYLRVKNWFTTQAGTNNPLGLPLEVPKEDYTYLYVPYKDANHPGIIGMSFQGDVACKGYWYADKIGETQDTVMKGTTPSSSQPANNNNNTPSATQSNPPPQNQNSPVLIQQQGVSPPQNSTHGEGNQPK